MANIELARAYVTIVPSMQGSQETITEALTGASVRLDRLPALKQVIPSELHSEVC